MNNDLQQQLNQQACIDLVLRAAAYADAGDALRFSQLFAEDAVLQRPNGEPLEGRSAIAAAYQKRPTGRMSRHLLTNILVEMHGADTASAHSQVLLWSCDDSEPVTVHGRKAHARQLLGEFNDHFCRTAEGHWLIARREARFVMFCDSPAA
ncbi:MULTISPECIES: nuclear transport factor 2 family protein [Comamonas]|uniref:nuclear transport factor 2 family protein n=1 Tax=Comamonas TaxID=283 RepID=UPI0001DA6A41|nr:MULTISPECIES: nuclear transport factor 2 family protein [Comamonas]EFI59108.1 hypothetical protein CTS44_23843 [Comamonas thiooxydans]TFF54681.1 DUF4440 domain-containing protein [Comamonas sp. A23]